MHKNMNSGAAKFGCFHLVSVSEEKKSSPEVRRPNSPQQDQKIRLDAAIPFWPPNLNFWGETLAARAQPAANFIFFFHVWHV